MPRTINVAMMMAVFCTFVLTSMGVGSANAGKASNGLNDAAIMAIYDQVNRFDIETALLGQVMGHSPKVRALGKMVSGDHTVFVRRHLPLRPKPASRQIYPPVVQQLQWLIMKSSKCCGKNLVLNSMPLISSTKLNSMKRRSAQLKSCLFHRLLIQNSRIILKLSCRISKVTLVRQNELPKNWASNRS